MAHGKQGYVTENHEGKLFRVRDKNDGDPYVVWGSQLTHEEAHALKERVCGRELSRTARIEDMTIPLAGLPTTPSGQPIQDEHEHPGVAAVVPPRPSSVVTAGNLHPNPQIAAAQAKAMAAARTAAAASQQRADNLITLPQHPHNVDAPIDEPEIELPPDLEQELDEISDNPEAAIAE